MVRGTAIDVANAMLAERDEKGGPNTKDRSRRPMTRESMADWIEVNRRRKAGWQVKVPVRNPDVGAPTSGQASRMGDVPSTLCGFHRLCAESHTAARGIANGRTPSSVSRHFVTPVVRHG